MATPRFNTNIHGRLHVFAAAARHLSFTRAAAELNVTPGAVSQQMRQLEERLGVKLFNRARHGVALTAEGQRLAQVVARSYGEVEDVLAHLQAGRIGGILRLRSIPSFLEKWIMPRLPALREAFPHISFRFVAEDSSWSLRDGEFDLAVDLNDGIYPGLTTTPLAREQIFPVCSPRLLERGMPLRGTRDLGAYPLLHDITAWRGSSAYAEWAFYVEQSARYADTDIGDDADAGGDAAAKGGDSRSAGGGDANRSWGDIQRGYTFNRYSLSLEAARAGLGVAIARHVLVTDELACGQLVMPFGRPVPHRKHYVLVYGEWALGDARIRAVHDWFVAQFDAGAAAR